VAGRSRVSALSSNTALRQLTKPGQVCRQIQWRLFCEELPLLLDWVVLFLLPVVFETLEVPNPSLNLANFLGIEF